MCNVELGEIFKELFSVDYIDKRKYSPFTQNIELY